MRRAVVFTGVVAAAALIPASGAVAQGAVVPMKKDVRLSIAAERVVAKTVRCPAGYVAVSGVAVPARRTAVLASVPRKPDSWRFRIANTRQRRVRVNAELRCMRIDVPSGDLLLRVGTASVQRALVPAGQATTERIRCPRGQVPLGFGADHGAPDSPGTSVQLTAVVPTRYGYFVGLENLGEADAVISVFARCVQRRQSAAGLDHRIRTRVVGFRGRLRRGIYRLRATCPRGHWSVETGHRFSPTASLFTLSSRPTGERGGRWYFASLTRKRDRVSAYLNCVDLRTEFR